MSNERTRAVSCAELCRIGLYFAIVTGICQQASAETTMPSVPDYSWLFDEGSGGTAAASHAGYDATLATGATWSTDTPFHYLGSHSVCVTSGEVTAPGFALGPAGTISMFE